MKKEAIIVDIDGTLTNIEHRLHHIINKDKKKDFDSFYEELVNDTPKQDIIDIVNILYEKYYVILLSGRPEKYLGLTLQWLNKFKVKWNEIFLRPDNNFSEDFVFKGELFEKEIKPFFKVIYVFEDRQSVVDMWRSKNLTCFQVHKWKDKKIFKKNRR